MNGKAYLRTTADFQRSGQRFYSVVDTVDSEVRPDGNGVTRRCTPPRLPLLSSGVQSVALGADAASKAQSWDADDDQNGTSWSKSQDVDEAQSRSASASAARASTSYTATASTSWKIP